MVLYIGSPKSEQAGKHFALKHKLQPGTAGASVLLAQAPNTAQPHCITLHQHRAPPVLPPKPVPCRRSGCQKASLVEAAVDGVQFLLYGF